jgi:non-lysosomal glucosylceramidase
MVRKAVRSIINYNLLTNFNLHDNCQRTYALNDEVGLLTCTWPRGGRPKIPFPYSHEVWTGIEYQVASLLILEGLVDEGLAIVKAVRDRYDGFKRSPWDEVECGHHYARSLSSWGLLLALSGFRCDMTRGIIEFEPKIYSDNFRCFWSTGTAWGTYTQKRNTKTEKLEKRVEILHGSIKAP